MKQKQTHRYRELEVPGGEREVGGARPVSGQRQKLLGIQSVSYRDIFYSTRKYRLYL